jgi:hypothetical protein
MMGDKCSIQNFLFLCVGYLFLFFLILPFETESHHVKNLHFANWKYLEIYRPPPPHPPKEGRWVIISGLGPCTLRETFVELPPQLPPPTFTPWI